MHTRGTHVYTGSVTKRWREVARATGLAAATGEVRPTIFAEMSALAATTGAANLGQGFPDADGPEWVREAAVEAIRNGANQYPPGPGIFELREQVAAHQARHYGIDVDPHHGVLITAGATEALTASVLALAGPGDVVVTLEPFFDSHAAAIAMAGAEHVTVPLIPSEAGGFQLDLAVLDTLDERTTVILINSPHNPTGAVLTAEEIDRITATAVRVDAVVVTDEVYEHLVFDEVSHVPIASLPGMFERTLSISSAGKTFSLTGWKIGWVTGPAALVTAVTAIKQFLTYVSGGPFQPAIARALRDGDADIVALRDDLAKRRDLLVDGLKRCGFQVVVPQGTYFVCADASAFLRDPDGAQSGAELARRLPTDAGVACVPLSAFCRQGSAAAVALDSWLRFTFVKDEHTLNTAIERLERYARQRGVIHASHRHE